MMRPRSLPIAVAVGKVTFREIVKDKILYNIVLCALLLLGVGVLASRLTFVRPERVVLDFGLSAIGISCSLIAVFSGASCLGRELERRTYYVAMARPISHLQFVCGKFCGLAAVLALNWLMLCAAFAIIFLVSGGTLTSTLGIAMLLLLVQCGLIAALAVFFSSFSTTSLSAIMTIGLYLTGNNISQLRLIASRVKNPVFAVLLKGSAAVLPNLEHFGLGTKVTYGLPVPWQFTVMSVCYGLVLTSLCLLVAGYLLWKKEA